MSSYNDYDFNVFDEDSQRRDERRRPPQRGSASVGRRRAYNIKKRRRKRLRNRIIIVVSGLLIIALLATLLTFMFKGCDTAKDNRESVSTDTIQKQEQNASTAPSAAATSPAEIKDDLSPAYFKTPVIEDDKTDGLSYYNIYVWKNIGFELFGGDKDRSEKYAKTINGFAEKLDGIKVYSMIVPNHTEMGLPQRLKDGDAYSTSQADSIKDAYAAMSSKVTPVNAYNYLADHNKEYIYFNSDHHWTGLGAYYAYKAFADTNGLEPLDLKDCEEQVIEDFTGTFSNTAPGLETDEVHYWELPYTVTMEITGEDGVPVQYDSPYYQNAVGGTLTYGVFIMGDNPLTVLKSSSEKAEEGKKIAVIKESYGNAFVPYLTYNYEEVHVMDLRTFAGVKGDLAAYCAENDIDEVLYLNGVMSANTQIQLDSMSGMLS